MRSISSVEKAFKSKARHFSSILGLARNHGYGLFSQVLGYRDFHAAQCAGFELPELPSREHLFERIKAVVEGVPVEKIRQVVEELNLVTTDRVLAQLQPRPAGRTDFSRYFSPDGTWSDEYRRCLSEVAPVFEAVHALSKEIGARSETPTDVRTVIEGLTKLSRDDMRIASALLTPSYRKYPDCLPLSAAMLMLHAPGNRGSTRALSKNVLTLLNGMLAHAASHAVLKLDHEVRWALERDGLAIAAAQRRMGAHDVCLDIYRGLAGLYQARDDHFDAMTVTLLTVEAAWSALFVRRYDTVLTLLALLPKQRVRASYSVMAIEAMARAQIGDNARATTLVDTLLCSSDVRMGLGLISGQAIPRRPPEGLPCNIDYLGLLDRQHGLDRLRYLDLAAFPLAQALFRNREGRMLGSLAASQLVFKDIRFFPQLRFQEKQERKRPSFFSRDSYTPAVLRFGPASKDGLEAHDERDVEIVVIGERRLLDARWSRPPQLSALFPANALFDKDPAKQDWLMHILASGCVAALQERAGLSGKSGLGLRERYRKSPELSRDEISFDIFRHTERVDDRSNVIAAASLSPELAAQIAQAFKTQLAGHLHGDGGQ